MLGTLVQGRVSLDGAAVAAVQARPEDRHPVRHRTPAVQRLLAHRRRGRCWTTSATSAGCFTRLATTYAAGFAHEQLLQKFDDVFSGAHDTDEDRQDLETLAAALKPLSTWHALDTLQECREACGGAGFLIENRFASLRADLDVYVTFEGDNTVLLQLVAKRLLADYAKEFRERGLRRAGPLRRRARRPAPRSTAPACARWPSSSRTPARCRRPPSPSGTRQASARC